MNCFVIILIKKHTYLAKTKSNQWEPRIFQVNSSVKNQFEKKIGHNLNPVQNVNDETEKMPPKYLPKNEQIQLLPSKPNLRKVLQFYVWKKITVGSI